MFCRNCGSKLEKDVRFCPECGTKVEDNLEYSFNNDNNFTFNNVVSEEIVVKKWTGIRIAAFIFMLLGILTSVGSIYTIGINNNGIFRKITFPLALIWQIPMTITYYKRVKSGVKNSTAFKVCSLIFVNLIAGILMLCDKDDKL